MTDRDPPAPTGLVRLLADVLDVHAVGCLAEVEMHVDVDVELLRELEDAVDLASRVAVRVRRSPDHACAASQRLDHQLVGSRVVQQPLLREDAELEVDRPAKLVDEREDTLDAGETDPRIDLDVGAHMRRPVEDRLLEGASRPVVDVLRSERLLRERHLLDCLCERSLVRAASVEETRLVEVDVSLDEARRHEPAADVDPLALGARARRDRDDSPVVDPDIDRLALARTGEPGVRENEVDHGSRAGKTSR